MNKSVRAVTLCCIVALPLFMAGRAASVCGNGVVESGEDCDLGIANGTAAACCTSGCTFRSAGMVCRAASAGQICDLTEVCTGSSASCPPDGVKPMGMVCRAASAGQTCDLAETCNGVSKVCPPDGVKPMGTICRAASAGQTCDLAEACNGMSKTCPADHFAPAGTVCRAGTAGQTCDVTEVCTGSSPSCPPDAVKPMGTVCRAATAGQFCDISETCNGSSKQCPPNAFKPSSTVCRAAAGVCDMAEHCTGSAPSCPPNAFKPNGTNCDDGLFCDGTEACQSGVCNSSGTPCGSGQNCEESNNTCFAGGCPPTAEPFGTCRTAGKSIMVLRDHVNDTKDKLVWKWIRGEPTTQQEFADPLTTEKYALCLYAGSSQALIGKANVAASPTKWTILDAKGYKYKDKLGTDSGIQRVLLKGSPQNKSKALMKGKGANLPDFNLTNTSIQVPLIVQLRNDRSGLINGVCWEGRFATPKKNGGGRFKAKTLM